MFTDITEQLRAAASELETGEMLHKNGDDDTGILNKALYAIELMDAKMDMSMIVIDDTSSTSTSSSSSSSSSESTQQSSSNTSDNAIEALKSKLFTYDQVQQVGLLPGMLHHSDLIGLMDELMIQEWWFYIGNSMEQSLFTCVALQRIDDIKHPWLRAYSIGLLKTASLIRTLMSRTSIHSEEDFISSTPMYDCLDNIEEGKVVDLLTQTENSIDDVIKLCKGDLTDAQEPEQQDQHTLVLSQLEAILCRIRLRKVCWGCIKCV
eukprot:TRINITY_DN3858_c0_g1_i2.p1 TRINITY_DN3858_c0_g1~~TRINITY_DN3858_c0_g1_i2.p1  ORF type:complete len:283 (+),score=96.65 TRINITY_DN3858_c0_g1_i2:58-849(+)